MVQHYVVSKAFDIIIDTKQQDIQQNVIAIVVCRTAVPWCHGHGFMVCRIA